MSWLAGAAWGVLSVFVLPVLALEDVGVRDALKRAAGLVRQRWGEGMAGLGNLTLVSVVLAVAAGLAFGVALAFAAVDPQAVAVTIVLGLLVFIVILFAVGTAGQVLALALYRHATGGAAIGPFTRDDLDHALVPRRRFRLRRRRE